MHVILNGVNSRTIQGLEITSLPPVSAPPKRTNQILIDGRDGDILEDLGYSAYDKAFTILLHNNYDPNEVIGFFSQSGTAIFSNEPDMVYTYEMVNGIDISKGNFNSVKVATITFHVQPYKLSATEEPATGEVSTLVDRTPYIIRRTPFGTRQKGTIVGGSIVWNQIFPTKTNSFTGDGYTILFNGDGSATVTVTADTASGTNSGNVTSLSAGTMTLGHKYLWTGEKNGISLNLKTLSRRTDTVFECTNAAFTNISVIFSSLAKGTYTIYPQIHDLTLMFGPTIADYIYTQEQATAGAGVAMAKAWAGITADYYSYDAGSIKSVTGLTAHRMTDGNGNIIGTYPLDSSLTLRGLPKLDGGSIYYDGDAYKADGTVERRYGVVDLGTRSWSYNSAEGNQYFYANISGKALGNANILCKRYAVTQAVATSTMVDKEIKGHATSTAVFIKDSAYTDAATFKASLAGVYLLYELATPTTETAEPYTELQICDPAGTEEFVGASMPVGHETTYIDPISMTVTNEGNTTSAPSITIEGEGAVEVTVDGLNILQIQMPASVEITIDSKTLDATDGEGGLANRSVTGDYNDLRLAPGEHTVTVTGDVTSVTLKNTSRWI